MVYRFNVALSIPNAGPSVNVWHTESFGDPQGAVAAIRGFYDAIKAILPTAVTVNFPAEAVVIDPVSGQVTSFEPVTPPATVVGTGSGSFAGGSGVRVVWNTGDVKNGRRVRGATFLVPAANSVYSANGVVSGVAVTPVATASAIMLTALQAIDTPLVVFSRPRPGVPGSSSEVTNGFASVMPGTLRSRKS